MTYRGRFAPSPSGEMHAGSLMTAMASYLDAKSHYGKWLVRIEDIDRERSSVNAAKKIIEVLYAHGMVPDENIIWQSNRNNFYQKAFDKLLKNIYPCLCSRKEISNFLLKNPKSKQLCPRFCRNGIENESQIKSWKIKLPKVNNYSDEISFHDRFYGLVCERLSAIEDFIIKRSNGNWAYQLAVVVDDDIQNISDIVRGDDLIESTFKQIFLQEILKFDTPRYLHIPVLKNDTGQKLSKQNGAEPICLSNPIRNLTDASQKLNLQLNTYAKNSLNSFWSSAISAWARKYL